MGWGGHEIYNFLSPYPIDATDDLVKIGLVVLEKKMLMDDAQRATHDDGSQPIAIRSPE